MIIRKIEKKDNQTIGEIVQKVLMEMGAPKVGTAYEDSYLFLLYDVYNEPRKVYFVVENGSEIIGGAGIAPLENSKENICELQKMYFLPVARGLGLGTQLITLCLDAAKEFGYEQCYLETMPYMKAAQQLYKKVGFTYLEKPMGNTGHTSCPIWMLKNL
jgi:putative acetyltransferase